MRPSSEIAAPLICGRDELENAFKKVPQQFSEILTCSYKGKILEKFCLLDRSCKYRIVSPGMEKYGIFWVLYGRTLHNSCWRCAARRSRELVQCPSMLLLCTKKYEPNRYRSYLTESFLISPKLQFFRRTLTTSSKENKWSS